MAFCFKEITPKHFWAPRPGQPIEFWGVDRRGMWWRTPWLRQRWLLISLALVDSVLVVLSYNALYRHRFGTWPGITTTVVGLLVLWVGSSYLLGRYSRPARDQQASWRRRLLDTLIVAMVVLVSIVVVLSWGIKVNDPRTFRNFVVPLLTSLCLGSGLAQVWVGNHRPQLRHWLLVAEQDELAVLQHAFDGEALGQRPQVCSPGDLGPLAQGERGPIEAIAVSEAAELADPQLQNLLAQRGSGMTICGLVVWAEEHLQRVPPELFSSRWLVQAEGFELQPGRWGWRLKRLGDVAVSLLLLVLTAPLLLLAAALIRLEDGGPIFYNQIRTGLYGQPIRIWKLRSMRQGAEQRGAQWASRDDQRITRTGAWLRSLRIDELPQLVSVLSGDMSLIGPRPERPELEETLERLIPHYRVRHWVRPGLSGWAQVCYPYGASIDDSRMKLSYDLYYLRNANLMLDLLILIKTLRLVLRGQGAIPQGQAQPAP